MFEEYNKVVKSMLNNAQMGRKGPTAIEGLAASLETTNGSLNPKIDGLLIRLSGSATPWDMEKPWSGREITGYTVRRTLWNKTALVKFYVDMSSTPNKLPIFSLQLALPMADEDIENAAQTYMMLLNMRRVE
jgi:hypothetical protein